MINVLSNVSKLNKTEQNFRWIQSNLIVWLNFIDFAGNQIKSNTEFFVSLIIKQIKHTLTEPTTVVW